MSADARAVAGVSRAARSLVLLMAALSWAAPAAAGDVDEGRRLSETHCARCHVIGDFNRLGGIGSTPSFQGLKNLADWRDRFRSFYARPPHLAFIRIEGIAPRTKLPAYAAEVKLTLDDVEDVFAFVETLAAR
jgi:mono/diheme cytochrome c family protein